MTIIKISEEKSKKDLAVESADKLIQYVTDNCTQSKEMLDFLKQPFLKDELIQIFLDSQLKKLKKR